MGAEVVAAIVFAVITALVVIFQLALALGAPWGTFAMGGAFPGKFPPAMRVAALVQAALLSAAALVILNAARVLPAPWGATPAWAVWAICALLAIGLLLNVITPSAGERRIWAPTVAVLLACSVIIALAA